jgi:hypothetical protein
MPKQIVACDDVSTFSESVINIGEIGEASKKLPYHKHRIFSTPAAG